MMQPSCNHALHYSSRHERIDRTRCTFKSAAISLPEAVEVTDSVSGATITSTLSTPVKDSMSSCLVGGEQVYLEQRRCQLVIHHTAQEHATRCNGNANE
jgi:hypothetical protein